MHLQKLCTICLTSILCLLAVPGIVNAQEDQDIAGRKQRISEFFTNLDGGLDSREIFDDFLADSPLLERKEELTRLVGRFEDIKEDSGKYSMVEAISEKRVGTDLILLKYLYKAENYPVVWNFIFYRRPSDKTKWIVISLRFDTRLEQLER